MKQIQMNDSEMKDFVRKNFANDPYNKFIGFEEKAGKTYVVYLPLDPGIEDRVEIREFVNSQLAEDEILA